MKTLTEQPRAAGEAAHTPTPYKLIELGGNNFRIVSESAAKGLAMSDLWVADIPNYSDHSKQDAAFIVRACNSHAALVAAADSIDRTVSSGGKVLASQYAALRAALKLATSH